MTITLAEQYALAQDATLKQRAIACLTNVALTVKAESQVGKTQVVNNARQNLVVRVIADPTGLQQSAMNVLSNNNTIQTSAYSGGPLNTANVLDSDITFVLTQSWNDFAGLRSGLDY